MVGAFASGDPPCHRMSALTGTAWHVLQGSPEERREAAKVNKAAMMDTAQKVPGVSRDEADRATGKAA
jgi:hypothetical protein